MVRFKALPKFEKQFKKFHAKEQNAVCNDLKRILADPALGELKKGALAGVRVHKFKIHNQLYLVAYEPALKEKTIYLYALGTHENFYKALERYLY